MKLVTKFVIIFGLMNFLDIILIIPIAFGAWKGFKKGLIIELFTLLALLVGIYSAIHFSDYMVEVVESNFNTQAKYTPIIAFVLTFILAGGVVYFLGKMLEKSINSSGLSGFNKFSGLILGGAKLMFVSAVLVIVIDAIDLRTDIITLQTKNESMLYQPLKTITTTAIPAIEDSELFKKEGLIDILLDKKSTIMDINNSLK
jgi:membrane protein required for colicin V production